MLLAFIPSAVLGLLFHDVIEKYLLVPASVAASLLVGGLFMIYAENKYRKNDIIQNIDQVGYKQAFVMGVFNVYLSCGQDFRVLQRQLLAGG